MLDDEFKVFSRPDDLAMPLSLMLGSEDGLKRLREGLKPKTLNNIVQVLRHDETGAFGAVIKGHFKNVGWQRTFGIVRSMLFHMPEEAAETVVRNMFGHHVTLQQFLTLNKRDNAAEIKRYGMKLKEAIQESDNAWVADFMGRLMVGCVETRSHLNA